MATSKEYFTYVLDLLREVKGISFKKMMGEYLLYKGDTLFGGVYDDRFLIIITKSSKLYGFSEQIPYLGGKPMLLVDIENSEEIKEIVDKVCADLD
ncbi:MAG: transcriptional regulator [Bacilli bacterium]|nr:transcriptional regulator [Bacilli bacterium]